MEKLTIFELAVGIIHRPARDLGFRHRKCVLCTKRLRFIRVKMFKLRVDGRQLLLLLSTDPPHSYKNTPEKSNLGPQENVTFKKAMKQGSCFGLSLLLLLLLLFLYFNKTLSCFREIAKQFNKKWQRIIITGVYSVRDTCLPIVLILSSQRATQPEQTDIVLYWLPQPPPPPP